ncbi:speckle-type POZ protein-like B [Nephila pilipes]|uniref:Speckle-type POZ protein-like B n=1 Tax=Nephila pilipes TaxID=299642 RepID=A0A8X6NXQ4_NEPPI|nr:speckle-type POZ protein-like B [Nephila pilipes]
MACYADAESNASVTFIWYIENYSFCWQEGNGYIESPIFTIFKIPEIEWKINLLPLEKNDENFAFCHLSGNFTNKCMLTSISVESELEILAEDGSVLQAGGREKITCSWGLHSGSNKLRVKREEVMNKIKAFLSRDTLRIRCRLWMINVNPLTSSTVLARTVLKVGKINFPWEIERFSFLKSGQRVNFILGSDMEDRSPIGIWVDEDDKIMIHLKWDDVFRRVIFQLFITDTNGDKIDNGRWEFVSNDIKKNNICRLLFTKKDLIDNKNTYLKNDVLSLYCEVSWCEGYAYNDIDRTDIGITSSCYYNVNIHNDCVSNIGVDQFDKIVDLKDDFKNLFTEGILSDVKLRSATQTFPTHKTILSARSPVFRKMFTTDMKEKSQECVDISDIDDDTTHRMLLYVYTNALEDLKWESASKLYAAADRFEIKALKSKCCSFLKHNLCPSNLCNVLVLADMHVDDDLKAAAQDYALKHEGVIFRSEEWMEFAKNNSNLALETMLRKWSKN